jgi:hypothetical protein
MQVCHDWALRSWILGWGPFGRVLAPEALAADVRADLEATRAQYHDHGSAGRLHIARA